MIVFNSFITPLEHRTSKAKLSRDGIIIMHTRVCRLHQNDRLYISSRKDSDWIGESIGPLGASTRDLAGSYRVPEYVRTFLRRRRELPSYDGHGTSSKDIEVSWIVCIVNRSTLLLITIFQLLSNALFNFKWTIKIKLAAFLSKSLFFYFRSNLKLQFQL